MKIALPFFILLPVLFLSNAAAAQSDSAQYPILTFESTVIIDTVYLDSGQEYAPYKNYTFHFTNTGIAPLIIRNVQSNDPCYACEYPEEPILPGKKGVIKTCCPDLYGSRYQKYTITSNAWNMPRLETRVVVIRR